MEPLKEASTDIIIVSNEFLIREDIVSEIDQHLNRGCNLIDVTNLQPMSIIQRMVCGLFEKSIIKGDDAFSVLSKYSSGLTTFVHMLTLLIQKYPSVKALVAYLNISNNFSASEQPLHTRINYILKSNEIFSSPAQNLLCCLSIVGSIPQPKFYVDELVVAVTTKDEKLLSDCAPGPLVNQLEQGGVLRKYPNPLVYHKDFNPETVDPTIQLMFIPKLICDAIDSEMDITDKAVSIMCVQHALENILTGNSTLSIIHLRYIMVLCNELFDVCVAECATLGDSYITESVKLNLRIAKYYEDFHNQ